MEPTNSDTKTKTSSSVTIQMRNEDGFYINFPHSQNPSYLLYRFNPLQSFNRNARRRELTRIIANSNRQRVVSGTPSLPEQPSTSENTATIITHPRRCSAMHDFFMQEWDCGSGFNRDMTTANVMRSSEKRYERYEIRMRIAAFTNNTISMQQLLSQGINPNNQDFHGRSPLHLASCRGYTEVIELLLKNGADPNLEDNKKNTPLHVAVIARQISAVKLLLSAGANVTATDLRGQHPLQMAQSRLAIAQNFIRTNVTVEMVKVKDEIKQIIEVLSVYFQRQMKLKKQMEHINSLCKNLSLSNNSESTITMQDLTANVKTLNITT